MMLSLKCSGPKTISPERFNGAFPMIADRIVATDDRATYFFVASAFRLLAGDDARIDSLYHDTDSMGGMDSQLVMKSARAELRLSYSQALRESWSSIEKLSCEMEYRSSGPERFFCDLDFSYSCAFSARFENLTTGQQQALSALVHECFTEAEEKRG